MTDVWRCLHCRVRPADVRLPDPGLYFTGNPAYDNVLQYGITQCYLPADTSEHIPP